MPKWKEIENADLAEIWPLRGRNTTESFSLPDERLENVNDQSQFNRKSRDLPFSATPLSIWWPLKSLFVTFWLLVEESTTKYDGIQWIQMIQYINIWKSLFSEIVFLFWVFCSTTHGVYIDERCYIELVYQTFFNFSFPSL